MRRPLQLLHRNLGIGKLSPHHNTRRRREDLDMVFRSGWEANYARYLRWQVQHGMIREWIYESEKFWFDKPRGRGKGVNSGVRHYLPDFKVTFLDGRVEYHEVKGYLTAQAKTALKRMKIYYPEITVRVIGKKEYSTIARQVGGIIPNWE
jgi:hypothetical protein